MGRAEREVDGVDALLLKLRHCQTKASKLQTTAIIIHDLKSKHFQHVKRNFKKRQSHEMALGISSNGEHKKKREMDSVIRQLI